jgi:hypothetical protein
VVLWFRGHGSLAKSHSGTNGDGDCGRVFLAKPFLQPMGVFPLWVITSLVAPIGAYLFFKEGAVCLLIGFPILFVCGFAGVLIGRLFFKSKMAAMNLSVIPVLLIATLAEGKMRQDQQHMVEDRLLINAPATAVWNYVVSFPTIDVAPNYWLNKVGLPSPLATTCQGAFVGAARKCIFTNGLVFKERVSEITPMARLTFQIVEQPHDPELLGHLTLHRGQFQLIVHLRVMEHIKTLAEGER